MRTRIVLFSLMLLILPGARAQGADAERLLKQDIDRLEQERRERRWDESHGPGLAPPPALPTPPPAAAGPCFRVQHIVLHPAGLLPARHVQRLLAAYQGRCLSAADLAALQQALNGLALAQGLVTTRVVVPEQNLAQGTLRLEIWPGRLEAVIATGLRGRELAQAVPLQPGELLQLRALEQAVDNLNRLASLQATIALEPGQQPGGSVARFTATRARPWQTALTWQGEALNGAPTQSLRGSLTVDSPLRLADRLTLGLNGNLQDGQVDDAHGGSADYDLPWGWWRLSAGADRFDYRNPVRAGLTPFMATGSSRAWRAELARRLYRDARHRLTLALHGKDRHSDNRIDGVAIGVSSTRVASLGLRLELSRVAAPWVWDASLDAEDGRGRTLARFSPVEAHYTRLLGSSRLQYYGPRTSLSLSLNGQWSDARLAPSEQFTLTGTVPGFSPLSLNANTGLGAQLELARPLVLTTAPLALRPTVGLAWARAPAAGDNAERMQLAALTAGLTLPWRRAVLHGGLAYPLHALNSVTAADRWQLDASLSLQW